MKEASEGVAGSMNARGEEKQSTTTAGGAAGGVEVFKIMDGDRRLSNGVEHKEGAGKHRLWVNLDTQHILGIAGHERGAALLTDSNIHHDHAVRMYVCMYALQLCILIMRYDTLQPTR